MSEKVLLSSSSVTLSSSFQNIIPNHGHGHPNMHWGANLVEDHEGDSRLSNLSSSEESSHQYHSKNLDFSYDLSSTSARRIKYMASSHIAAPAPPPNPPPPSSRKRKLPGLTSVNETEYDTVAPPFDDRIREEREMNKNQMKNSFLTNNISHINKRQRKKNSFYFSENYNNLEVDKKESIKEDEGRKNEREQKRKVENDLLGKDTLCYEYKPYYTDEDNQNNQNLGNKAAVTYRAKCNSNLSQHSSQHNTKTSSNGQPSTGKGKTKRNSSSTNLSVQGNDSGQGSQKSGDKNNRDNNNNKKRKENNSHEVQGNKKRFVWPEELHKDFVNAIFDVGLQFANSRLIKEAALDHNLQEINYKEDDVNMGTNLQKEEAEEINRKREGRGGEEKDDEARDISMKKDGEDSLSKEIRIDTDPKPNVDNNRVGDPLSSNQVQGHLFKLRLHRMTYFSQLKKKLKVAVSGTGSAFDSQTKLVDTADGVSPLEKKSNNNENFQETTSINRNLKKLLEYAENHTLGQLNLYYNYQNLLSSQLHHHQILLNQFRAHASAIGVSQGGSPNHRGTSTVNNNLWNSTRSMSVNRNISGNSNGHNHLHGETTGYKSPRFSHLSSTGNIKMNTHERGIMTNNITSSSSGSINYIPKPTSPYAVSPNISSRSGHNNIVRPPSINTNFKEFPLIESKQNLQYNYHQQREKKKSNMIEKAQGQNENLTNNEPISPRSNFPRRSRSKSTEYMQKQMRAHMDLHRQLKERRDDQLSQHHFNFEDVNLREGEISNQIDPKNDPENTNLLSILPYLLGREISFKNSDYKNEIETTTSPQSDAHMLSQPFLNTFNFPQASTTNEKGNIIPSSSRQSLALNGFNDDPSSDKGTRSRSRVETSANTGNSKQALKETDNLATYHYSNNDAFGNLDTLAALFASNGNTNTNNGITGSNLEKSPNFNDATVLSQEILNRMPNNTMNYDSLPLISSNLSPKRLRGESLANEVEHAFSRSGAGDSHMHLKRDQSDETAQSTADTYPLRSFQQFRQYPPQSILAFSPTRNLLSSTLELTHPMHMQSNLIGNNNKNNNNSKRGISSLLSNQSDVTSTNNNLNTTHLSNNERRNSNLSPGPLTRSGSIDSSANVLQSILNNNSLINTGNGNGEGGLGNEFRWTLGDTEQESLFDFLLDS